MSLVWSSLWSHEIMHGEALTLAKDSPIAPLPKRVPMTLRTFSFCRTPSKMQGICREKTSMTSLSFCTQHTH